MHLRLVGAWARRPARLTREPPHGDSSGAQAGREAATRAARLQADCWWEWDAPPVSWRATTSRNSLEDSEMSTERASTQPWRKLYAITAGIATSRPNAVVMSASAIPAEMVPKPPEPDSAICWKALMMPIVVPSRP